MFKNYLKIAYRNILKQRAYSVINILGLAFGLAVCILAGLFIRQELHYDDYHINGDQIYRISVFTNSAQEDFHSAETPALTAPVLEQEYPEIKKITRIYFPEKQLVDSGEKKIYEEELVFADECFFEIFSYKFIEGSSATALREKNSIVLTRSTAEKYFTSGDPVGQSLKYNDTIEFKVTGIIEDVPVNSHFTYNMVATYSSIEDLPEGSNLDQWGATFGSYSYVLLESGTDPEEFGKKIAPFLNEKMQVNEGVYKSFILQPLSTIHLCSDLEDEITSGISVIDLMILCAIAVFIMILACINFINLTTARAVRRAREIGVRKVFGALKHQLIKQFLGESVIFTMISLVFALVIVELIEPYINILTGIELTATFYNDAGIMAVILISAIMIGILSGSYPAFILTRFQPVQVLKGTMHRDSGGFSFLRKILVLLQYSISLILIIFTIVINQQVRFMRNYDMGFDKEKVVILKTPERMSYTSETIKGEFASLPAVVKTTASFGVQVMDGGFGTLLIPDMAHEDEYFIVSVRFIDFDYIDFYDLELLAGKTFSEIGRFNYNTKTIVNETTVKMLGFSSPEEALGKRYTIGISDGLNNYTPEIIGVVQDFHFRSLHDEVTPLLFMYHPYFFEELSLKIVNSDVPAAIKEIGSVWEQFYPEHPFDYVFLDEKIDSLYRAEEKSFKIITTFSALAVFIACMGLLGLIIYTTEQRRKEIGIRKVLGASFFSILNNISTEFLRIVAVANLIAWPVSYFLIKRWLSSFPYKVQVGIEVFLSAGVITLFLSILSIGYTVFRSAAADPADSLICE